MRKLLFYGMFLCAIAVFFSACIESDKDKDGIVDNLDKCPDVAAKTKTGCPVKKEVEKIHFYMETSASMGGYFNRDAEFKTIVSDLTVKLSKIKPVDIWFVADSATRYPKDVESFSADIATTKPAIQKSSELHKILGQIAAKTDSNAVSVFVSDCILSFSNADVKANPEVNKTDAYSLKNKIFSTFTELRKRGQAVDIYAFKSKFYGTYYDYQNVKIKINGSPRPFYIWVIGHKDLLKDFNSRLSGISTFKPEQSLQFGLLDQPVSKAQLLTQVEKNGSWIKGENETEITDLEIPQNDSLKFCTALNLDSLPAYVQNSKYLQDNLQIKTNGCLATVVAKEKSAIDKSKLRGGRQPEIFANATHFLVFSVASMDLKNASIQVVLPKKYDTWYQNWSTMDDKGKNAFEQKTFAFEYLANGIMEAYETKNKNYIDFPIHLSK
jgi:hypothetical protein